MVPVMVQRCFCGYWFLRKRMLNTMITMMIIFSHSHLVRAQLGAGHNSSASWPPCTLGSKHWSDHQFFFQFSFQILMLVKTPGHILQQCWRELFDLQNKITSYLNLAVVEWSQHLDVDYILFYLYIWWLWGCFLLVSLRTSLVAPPEEVVPHPGN